jgi:hypothetical protein
VGFAAAVEGSPGDTKKTHQGRKLEKADRSGVGRDGVKQDGASQGFERTLWGAWVGIQDKSQCKRPKHPRSRHHCKG